jgi:myosin-1
VKEADLEKILLFEKKQFLKEFTFSPYSKSKCISNSNTLSKAIYNSIFEFIIYKIQKSLKPEGTKNVQEYLSINILDIFGFENFELNSF